MEKTNTHIGMTFDRDRIRYAVMGHGSVPTLLAAGETGVDTSFDYSACNDEKQIFRQAAAIEAIAELQNLAGGQVSFAMDQSYLLLKRLRVDSELTDEEIRQHIEWEMEQFLVAPRDDYHVSYERARGDGDRFEHLVVAALRKSIINHVQAVFAKTGLALKGIDVNVLSAIRGLAVAGNLASTGLETLVHISGDRLQVLVIKNGSFLTVQTSTLRTGPAEALASQINDEILHSLDALGDEVLLKNINRLYVADPEITPQVVAALQPMLRTTEIVVVDPLQQITHTLTVEAGRIVRENAGSFLPIIGLFVA
jgi:hypothetical protein